MPGGHGLRAGVVPSEMAGPARRSALETFESGELSAPRVLDEGIDVPSADLAVIAGASHSGRQMVQRMGRVLRRKEDGRRARFARLYVEGTVEDPHQGANGAYLDEMVDVVEEVRWFPLRLRRGIRPVRATSSRPRQHASRNRCRAWPKEAVIVKQKPRRQQGRRAQPKGTPPASPMSPQVTPTELGVADEIQHVLDTPLAELMFGPEDKALAEELSRQAVSAPAMARIRTVVEFVGTGRPATKAGNLKLADARSLAERLGTGDQAPLEMRSMDDLPETTHAFRWAVAAEFLALRGNQIVPGPSAPDFEQDPLLAWFKAASTLLEHGPLDGFRRGWRKSYVEFIDASVTSLLAAIAEAGDWVPIVDLEDNAWEQVADAYGYQIRDNKERRYVVNLVGALVNQLADIGVMMREDDEVVLTGLGVLLASVASLADLGEFNDDELDLVDTDAQSLLLVCAEEMEPAEATGHLLAWCQARPANEAADELCQAMLDDDDPIVWGLGFEALGMIDPAVADAAVRELRPHKGLRPRADAWLRSRPPTPPR